MPGSQPPENNLPPALCEAAYAQLRELAAFYLAGRGGTVLQATSLVHEAFVRLARSGRREWESQTHFAAAAATVMRRVLIDEIRARSRARLDGDTGSLQIAAEGKDAPLLELLALDEALRDLAQLSERQARIVELRYFGGLTVAEAAEILAVSPRTVENDWSIARAWLRAKLESRS